MALVVDDGVTDGNDDTMPCIAGFCLLLLIGNGSSSHGILQLIDHMLVIHRADHDSSAISTNTGISFPIEQVRFSDTLSLNCRLEHVKQKLIIGLVLVVVAAHFFIFVRVDARVADSATKAGLGPGGAYFAGRVRVLARQSKVKHVDLASGGRRPANGKVGRLDVSMQEADRVNVLNGDQNLTAESQCGVGGAAADKAAHVVPALQPSQHGHLHFEHLFGLFCRLKLQRHALLAHQVHRFVDLAEAAAADFAGHFPPLFDHVLRLQ
ncbi:hypothetical protein BpHYR1_033467 [Brachionus plicatilis]|uniref:Uncharacterized protein n=1 Tax=Brachionus plicatilis TaxID=10195 RepID=A0A3M7ST70_BRAPC|nr:hypothetical protein BpHYR1_033467 [Brachionus plicatilis]